MAYIDALLLDPEFKEKNRAAYVNLDRNPTALIKNGDEFNDFLEKTFKKVRQTITGKPNSIDDQVTLKKLCHEINEIFLEIKKVLDPRDSGKRASWSRNLLRVLNRALLNTRREINNTYKLSEGRVNDDDREFESQSEVVLIKSLPIKDEFEFEVSLVMEKFDAFLVEILDGFVHELQKNKILSKNDEEILSFDLLCLDSWLISSLKEISRQVRDHLMSTSGDSPIPWGDFVDMVVGSLNLEIEKMDLGMKSYSRNTSVPLTF